LVVTTGNGIDKIHRFVYIDTILVSFTRAEEVTMVTPAVVGSERQRIAGAYRADSATVIQYLVGSYGLDQATAQDIVQDAYSRILIRGCPYKFALLVKASTRLAINHHRNRRTHAAAHVTITATSPQYSEITVQQRPTPAYLRLSGDARLFAETLATSAVSVTDLAKAHGVHPQSVFYCIRQGLAAADSTHTA
jgi:DNA-directed RNA polymerase specialized sigma24 family protein